MKDKSFNLLSAENDKKKIITHGSRVSLRGSMLSGEVDGGRILGNQEDNSCASFSSFVSSAEHEREISFSAVIALVPHCLRRCSPVLYRAVVYTFVA